MGELALYGHVQRVRLLNAAVLQCRDAEEVRITLEVPLRRISAGQRLVDIASENELIDFNSGSPFARDYLAARRARVPLIKIWALDHICLFARVMPLPSESRFHR